METEHGGRKRTVFGDGCCSCWIVSTLEQTLAASKDRVSIEDSPPSCLSLDTAAGSGQVSGAILRCWNLSNYDTSGQTTRLSTGNLRNAWQI